MGARSAPRAIWFRSPERARSASIFGQRRCLWCKREQQHMWTRECSPKMYRLYNTTKWRVQNDTILQGSGLDVFYTALPATHTQPATVFAIAMEWPQDNQLHLHAPCPSKHTQVSLVGTSEPCQWRPMSKQFNGSTSPFQSKGLTIIVPRLSPRELPLPRGPWVFRLQGVH